MRSIVAVWTLSVVGALTGCSVLAGAPPGANLPCRVVDGEDPCPDVYGDVSVRCSDPTGGEGTCTSTECGQEQCNGVDDDCDGVVDEGEAESCNGEDDDCDGAVDEDLDEDGDGYSWCPLLPTPVDCDDNDPDVRPERGDDPCDGADSDCNAATPDGSNCAADEECDPLSCTGEGCTPAMRCQEINCRNRPELCADDQYCAVDMTPPTCQPLFEDCREPTFPCTAPQRCNTATGNCVNASPNGQPCSYDAECASNLCMRAEALRLVSEHTSAALGICSRACCADSECDVGSRCWTPGSGARGCVPEEILNMGSHGAPSITACAGSGGCGSTQWCALERDDAYTVTGRISLTCRAPRATPRSCSNGFDCGFGEFCSSGVCRRSSCDSVDDCPTGMCAGGRCVDSCRSAAECPPEEGWPFNFGEPSCVYGGIDVGGRIDYFPFCTYGRGGGGQNGASCTTNSDCRDLTCVGPDGTADTTPKTCAATCCNDANCGDQGQCRPLFIGNWEMHCLPRPVFTTGGGS